MACGTKSAMKSTFVAPLVSVLALGACVASSEDAETTEAALVSSVKVLTQHNDAARTGVNSDEHVLTPQNVSSATFGKLFERQVDGQVYAQPLYVGGAIAGKNVVYVATEHDSVYAFDADAPAASQPLWKTSLGAPMPASDTNNCHDLAPEIGITATPVIDFAAQTIFVSAKTKENGAYVYRLHALDLVTGKPKQPAVVITATLPGQGAGARNGTIEFDARRHLNRPGLLLAGGKVWLAFGSHCDGDPYHGWIFAYDAATLTRDVAWLDTPDGERGGIWQSGVGLAADSAGNVYLVSGNGSFDGKKSFGGSIVKLTPQGNVASWFSPGNVASLNQQDLDIGGTGALLVPGTNRLVTGGKQGFFYVVDRDHMGGSTPNDAQIVQKVRLTEHEAWGAPAFFDSRMYVWGKDDHLKSYAWNGSTFDPTPIVNTSTETRGTRGGQLAISSSGASAGVLWATHPDASGAGFLAAYDASDITRELWRSGSADLGAHAKFVPPTIANGHVYVATFSGKVVVYGLKAGGAGDAGAPDAADAADAADAQADVHVQTPTWSSLYAQFFGPGTPGHCGDSGCHASARGGFACGTTKASCYAGLVASGLVDAQAPASSPLGDRDTSPLAWFGGGMPADRPTPNPTAAAAVTAWLAAGAHQN